MKRFVWLGLIAVGCAPAAQNSSVGAPPTPAPTPVAVAPTPKSATPLKEGFNPNRVHQLTELSKVDLSVKGNTVHAWIMDDEAKTQEGMMFLTDKEVNANEGMLFAFDLEQKKTYPDGSPRGFWMHNTLIPLDIIFMSPKGKVFNIGNGKVQDDTTVASQGDFQYVLELKAGTAARFGLKAGDTISIPALPKP